MGGGINVGDVVYITDSDISIINIESWDNSLGTPIGIIAIPPGILPDGMARICSLQYATSSGDSSTFTATKWGPYKDTSLNNYSYLPIVDFNTQELNGTSTKIFIPSDIGTGKQSIIDPIAYYSSGAAGELGPAAYAGSVLNPEFNKYALSDFNGYNNTVILSALGTKYIAATLAINYSGGCTNLNWYLPAIGELGVFYARSNMINNTLTTLGYPKLTPNSYSYLHSSTEISQLSAWQIDMNSGCIVNSYGKNNSSMCAVRPFMLIPDSFANWIIFKFEGKNVVAEKDMTWKEWISSDHGVSAVSCINGEIWFKKRIKFIITILQYWIPIL